MSAADSSAALRDLSEQLRSEGKGADDELADEAEDLDPFTAQSAPPYEATAEAKLAGHEGLNSPASDFIEAEDGSGSALISVLSWLVAALAVAAVVWLALTGLVLEAIITALGAFFAVCLLQVSAHVVRLQEQQRWVLLQLLALQHQQAFSQAQASSHLATNSADSDYDSYAD